MSDFDSNKFRDEIEQTLFRELHFDETLKEKVRMKQATRIKKRLLHRTWVKPGIMIAAVFTLVFLSTILLQNDKPNELSIDQTFMGGEENAELFVESSNESWTLYSADEVKQILGQDVLLPNYIPENYELESIQANGESLRDIDQVIFTYSSKDGIYLVIIENAKESIESQGSETIDINGKTAYVKTVGEDENVYIELYWQMGNFRYVINGSILQDEAILIAKSFQ